MPWEERIPAEIVDEIREIYEPKREENLYYIGLEHIEQQSLALTGIGNSNETQSSKRKFKKGDILFINSGWPSLSSLR